MKYFNQSDEQTTPEVAAAAGSLTPGPTESRSRGSAARAKMVLNVYGMNYPAIDSALQKVDQLCKESEKTQVVRHPDVGKLTSDQVGL